MEDPDENMGFYGFIDRQHRLSSYWQMLELGYPVIDADMMERFWYVGVFEHTFEVVYFLTDVEIQSEAKCLKKVVLFVKKGSLLDDMTTAV